MNRGAQGRPWRAGVYALQVLHSSRHAMMCAFCMLSLCSPSGHAKLEGLTTLLGLYIPGLTAPHISRRSPPALCTARGCNLQTSSSATHMPILQELMQPSISS